MEKTPLTRNTLNDLSSIILDAAIVVHKEMGPGLLEGVYQHCMVKEIQRQRNRNFYHGANSVVL